MASKNSVDITYYQWLADLKEKIRNSQLKAALKVNTEMLALYWEIGKELTEKQAQSNWGDKIITQLAKDLSSEFPGVKGFSATNLKYIRKWFQFYNSIGQQAVDQLKITDEKPAITKSQQPVDQTVQQPAGLLPVILGQVPWGHHIQIITKAANPAEAIFYLQQASINNWSRAVLLHQIETGLYHRTGTAITNFEFTLPKAQSDLARETLKNPYSFDFLGLGEEIQERELEKALIQHMKKFLLELGRGFAYVGNQYNLVVEDDDYYLDLFFFNIQLNCYVVFELKVGEFKPEFAGKLNFYINTINEQIKGPAHAPTIGVLLCKTPNKTVVEYSLKGIDTAMGVSEYELTKALPKQLKAEMPSIKELEQELEKEVTILQERLGEKKKTLREKLQNIKTTESIQNLLSRIIPEIKERAEFLISEETQFFEKTFINTSVNNILYENLSEIEAVDILKNETVQEMGLLIEVEGLKKGISDFKVESRLMFYLQRYKYEIIIYPGGDSYEKLYHDKWLDQDLQNISEQWITSFIDNINKKLDQTY